MCKAKKSDHIHPILETLHWLPVAHVSHSINQYKISIICFNSISGTAPHYLSDLLQPYSIPQQDNYHPHPTHEPLSPLVYTQKHLVKGHFLMLAHLWNILPFYKHFASLLLPPLLKLPTRCTHSITISKLFHSMPIPLLDVCVCVCVLVLL